MNRRKIRRLKNISMPDVEIKRGELCLIYDYKVLTSDLQTLTRSYGKQTFIVLKVEVIKRVFRLCQQTCSPLSYVNTLHSLPRLCHFRILLFGYYNFYNAQHDKKKQIEELFFLFDHRHRHITVIIKLEKISKKKKKLN